MKETFKHLHDSIIKHPFKMLLSYAICKILNLVSDISKKAKVTKKQETIFLKSTF